MAIAISPHTKGTILSSPAQLTVNTLKVKVPSRCITRNEGLLKKLMPLHKKKIENKKQTNKDCYLDFSVYEIYIILLNHFYLCKKKNDGESSNFHVQMSPLQLM